MPRSKYLQIATQLREELEDGRFPEGEPMPSMTALHERFGAARMTVRAALALLIDEGYIEGSGQAFYPRPHAQWSKRRGSSEAEMEDVRAEDDPIEQARKATELIAIYEVRVRSLVTIRRRAIQRLERQGMSRTKIAAALGVSKARITQVMEGIPAESRSRSRSSV